MTHLRSCTIRQGLVLWGLLVTSTAGPAGETPRSPTSLPPEGRAVAKLTLRHGDLRAVLQDNSDSPQTLSGLQSLFDSRDEPDFDAFDPDTAGASAGLNFEHIISGHADPNNRFAPRQGPYRLYDMGDGRSAVLVRRREDSPWEVSSSLRYTLVEPHAVDFQFRCTPHDPTRFGPRRYVIFFFANYMNDVVSPTIHFRGIARPGGQETWIHADAPPGPPDWMRGGTYRAADATPTAYDADHGFPLNSWSYDFPRFTLPFYYGRTARGMVFLVMFDRARTPVDEIRFSLFKFKLPAKPRPAWDFQYVIHEVEEDREYGFRGRLVWKKWISPDDCLEEYNRWRRECLATE